MKLLILADDFTGAMDTGVQLSKAHIKTLVFSKVPSEKIDTDSCQVLVINTNLRHSPPETAYTVIQELLHIYAEQNLPIYIKTDSALRGNISAEAAAAVHTLGRPLHFIPAFPDAKRTLREGIVYIEDKLLEESVFRNDPRSPMTESSLIKILNRDYPLSCSLVKRDNCSITPNCRKETSVSFSEKASNTAEKQASAPSETDVFLYDGESNEDLARIASILKEENQLTLTAGCAGFAKQFPKLLDFETEPAYRPSQAGPVLFFSGSANAVTFRQLAAAKKAGYPLFSIASYLKAYIETHLASKCSPVGTGDEASETEAKPVETESGMSNIKPGLAAIASGPKAMGLGLIGMECGLVALAEDALKKNRCVLLATALGPEELLDFASLSALAGSTEAVHDLISQACSQLLHHILDASGISYLTVFGGDTVAGILEELHCSCVFAKGEISTGVPLCLFPYQERTMHLVTKSGGLGCEDIVETIVHYFNGE